MNAFGRRTKFTWRFSGVTHLARDPNAGGWDTVRLYEANPITSDSEDESNIYKAENRPLKRKRSSSRGKASTVTSGSRSNDSVSVPPSQPWGKGTRVFSAIVDTIYISRSAAFSWPIWDPTTLSRIAGSTTTSVESALTSTEELGLSRFSQPVKQNSQTVAQNRDSLKDE